METTFISIHDLSLDARIRYASDSVEDILGYLPHEVVGKPCWDYFHPHEIPFAKAGHGRGVELDKAAALFYCKVKHRDGSFITCECVFTVVYDVLVASTSIYRRGARSLQRQKDAPMIQRLFSSSPRDSRYHMLSYISSKFSEPPAPTAHEPRAALFLNRFTRTSTIMYATDGVAGILGVRADELIHKSFYYCIAHECLADAVRCLESAKSNDSIAYLRFRFRNPVIEERHRAALERETQSSDDDEDNHGGVRLHRPPGSPHATGATPSTTANHLPRHSQPQALSASQANGEDDHNSRATSANSTDLGDRSHATSFGDRVTEGSSASSVDPVDDGPLCFDPVEVEAVVSCTSDGLVVILRRANPTSPQHYGPPPAQRLEDSLFATPWAVPASAAGAPPEPPGILGSATASASVTVPGADALAGPETSAVMSAIREVAVFAWSLTGINGSLIRHRRGDPEGQALPADGLPVWDPNSHHPENDQYNGFADNSHRRMSVERQDAASLSSSEDEVVFKRAKVMPEWKKPVRRDHRDAFGSPGEAGPADDEPSPARKRKFDRKGA